MPNKEISLADLVNSFGYFHLKIDQKFLKTLLINAAEDENPHHNMEFMKNLSMKPTSTTKYCYTIYGWTRNRTIPLGKLTKIAKLAGYPAKVIESKIISIKSGQQGGEICPKFPIRFDKNLGSIIGHILGDGSIDSRYKQVFFSNSNKELLKEFIENMKKVFGVKPRIWMQMKTIPFKEKTRWERRLNSIEELEGGKNCGLFYPTITGLILNHIFDNFAVGRNKNLPSFIFNLSKDFKAGLIRAFYDDEGSVNVESYTIRLFQDRKDILEFFRLLLAEFEISSSNILSYKKRGKDRYYFNIHRKENFRKFYEQIGFTSTKKSSRLRALAQ